MSLFFSDDDDDEEEEEGGEGRDLAIRHSCLLLRYILQCLTKCFLYDRTGFLTKERFHSLMQPLVDQVRVSKQCNQRQGFIWRYSFEEKLCMLWKSFSLAMAAAHLEVSGFTGFPPKSYHCAALAY